MKPRLLDLFCGGGGATRGYQLAGFHVTGVDINPQPRYCGDEFHQADAMTFPLNGFDVVHAGPPCQGYSTMTADHSRHPQLIAAVRDKLTSNGTPYVIENVAGARRHMSSAIQLCGSSFGLQVRRHRLFESNLFLMPQPCAHSEAPVGVYGDHPDRPGGWLRPGGTSRGVKATSLEQAQEAMGIDWMKWWELTEAIPPVFTSYVGEQLLMHLGVAA